MAPGLERLTSLMVADVMNRNVVQIASGQSMKQAAGTLANSHVSGAPVVDAEGRCVGILSANDFVHREANPTDEDRVSCFMSSGVQSVQPEATLIKAAEMMCALHVHRLPVLDRHEKPVGLITSMDIVAALVNVVSEAEAYNQR